MRPTAGEGRVLGDSISAPKRYMHRVGALLESPALWRAAARPPGADTRGLGAAGGHRLVAAAGFASTVVELMANDARASHGGRAAEALAERLRQPRDRRSIGQAEAVAAELLAAPERFAELLDAIGHEDPLVRMRAADATEKLTRRRPDLLAPHTERILGQIAHVPQHEVRWHVAQLVPRLPLNATQRAQAAALLTTYLDDRSRIVQTFALQALADLADTDRALRDTVTALLHRMTAHESAAVRARARTLLARTEPPPATVP